MPSSDDDVVEVLDPGCSKGKRRLVDGSVGSRDRSIDLTSDAPGKAPAIGSVKRRREVDEDAIGVPKPLLQQDNTMPITPPPPNALSIPSNWTGGEHCERRLLEEEDAADQKEYSEVAAAFHATCPEDSFIISSIQKLQKRALWRMYSLLKQDWDGNGKGANEMLLFHGTDKATSDKVAAKSFNRSDAGRHATAYGLGTYFDKTAKSADENAKGKEAFGDVFQYMFRARVLVGNTTLGNARMKEAPDGFHSTRDPSGSVFVSYLDAQAYPEHLIIYRTRAGAHAGDS